MNGKRDKAQADLVAAGLPDWLGIKAKPAEAPPAVAGGAGVPPASAEAGKMPAPQPPAAVASDPDTADIEAKLKAAVNDWINKKVKK